MRRLVKSGYGRFASGTAVGRLTGVLLFGTYASAGGPGDNIFNGCPAFVGVGYDAPTTLQSSYPDGTYASWSFLPFGLKCVKKTGDAFTITREPSWALSAAFVGELLLGLVALWLLLGAPLPRRHSPRSKQWRGGGPPVTGAVGQHPSD